MCIDRHRQSIAIGAASIHVGTIFPKRSTTMKQELRGSISILAALAVLVLLASALELPVPNADVLDSVRFHIAAACLAFPVVLYLLGARWRAVLALGFILACVAQGAYVIHTQQRARDTMGPAIAGDGFSIMNFNVLSTSDRGTEIADYMISQAPDIAVILETPGIESALDRLKATFPYRIGCENSRTCDLSLFSRTPFVNAQMHLLGQMKRQRLISARTIIDGRTVTIVALHLSKPYFDRMSIGELWQVTRLLRQIEGPVLLSGDFNSAAWSRNLRRFVARNELAPPPRYPSTWPVRLGELGVPIDNMFTRGALRIDEIGAMPSNFASNHRGLLAHATFTTAPDTTSN